MQRDGRRAFRPCAHSFWLDLSVNGRVIIPVGRLQLCPSPNIGSGGAANPTLNTSQSRLVGGFLSGHLFRIRVGGVWGGCPGPKKDGPAPQKNCHPPLVGADFVASGVILRRRMPCIRPNAVFLKRFPILLCVCGGRFFHSCVVVFMDRFADPDHVSNRSGAFHKQAKFFFWESCSPLKRCSELELCSHNDRQIF